MKAAESRAEIYLMALQSLSKHEREIIFSRLLEDEKIREDIIDLVTIYTRKKEPSRPFKQYLMNEKNKS